MNYSTEGIIINIRSFLEADSIVTILSKEKGRQDLVAKSARKPTTRKSSSIEFLNFGKFGCAKGKNMDIILEISLIDDIYKNFNVEISSFIFYFCELLNKSLVNQGLNDNFWDILIECRKNLVHNPELSILKLQLSILDELGALPDILTCQICGKSLKNSRYFKINYVGYFCDEHSLNGSEISDTYLKIQNFIRINNFGKILKLDIREKDYRYLLNLQNEWIEYIIDKGINSFKLLFYTDTKL